MKRTLALASLLLACVSVAIAEEKEALTVHAALQQAGSYEFGQSRKALIVLETACEAAVGDAAKMNDLEQPLLKLLKAEETTPDAKRFICRLLSLVGTDISAETLGALYLDPQYSGQALLALEAIGTPFAQAVIGRYVADLNPTQEAAAIAALGRLDHSALDKLADKLFASDSDPVRAAAADALARVGTVENCAKLAAHAEQATNDAPLYNGCLECARIAAAAEGQSALALQLWQVLSAAEAPAHVRAAAYVQMAASVPFADASQEAARQEIMAAAKTDTRIEMERASAAVLAASPDGAAGLLAMLQKNEPAADAIALGALERMKYAGDLAPVIAKLDSESADVRAAAMRVLRVSGSDAAFDPLWARVTGESAEARREATTALSQLNAPGVNARLLDILANGETPAKVAALSMLTQRNAKDAHDAIRAAADSTDAAVFEAAHEALRVLATEPDLAGLIEKAVDPADPARAATYAGTVVTLALRLPEDDRTTLLRDLYSKAENPATRATLMGLVGRVGGVPALEVLKAGAKDADSGVKLAAVKGLSDWPDPEALPALLEAMQEDPRSDTGEEAFNGIARLLREDKASSLIEMEYLEALNAAAESDADKRRLLQAIAGVTTQGAFRMADNMRRMEGLTNDVEQTLVGLAERLAGAYPQGVQGRMLSIANGKGRDETRARAKVASDAIAAFGPYITSWVVSGPYTMEGKRAHELHDVQFAPESGLYCGDSVGAGHLGWEIMPVSLNPATPGYVDLSKEYGANECVAYLRTCFKLGVNQVGMLRVGSDDGCKVWHNGELRLSNLGMRHYQADQDEVMLELNEGEHTIIIAVYQHASDWGFSARLTNAQDEPIPTMVVIDPTIQ